MNAFFIEKWSDEGPGIIAPLAREIARIGYALNRMRINGNPVEITQRGIDATVAAGAGSTTLPFVFLFRKTSDTAGVWVPGKGYLGGADTTITGQPGVGAVSEELTGITTTRKYWILHDFSAATLTWATGTSYPAASDSQEPYRMLEITCTDGKITSFICPHPCDIHATAKST